MSRSRKFIASIVTCLFLITGCKSIPEDLPTELPMETLTFLPTLSPSETPIRPTATKKPTLTATDFVLEPNAISLSPDGLWTAKIFDLYPLSYMDVVNADETKMWTIIHDGEATGWYEATIQPIHWSGDGKYLYYSIHPFLDGFILFNNGSGLIRLSLDDGSPEIILDNGNNLYTVAVSPDSSALAYFRLSGDPHSIVIRDLSSSKERSWTLDDRYSQLGNITWSPDGGKVFLQLAAGSSWETVSFTLAVINLSLPAFTEYLPETAPHLRTVEWSDDNTVLLEDWDQNLWQLDISTGQITSVQTSTP